MEWGITAEEIRQIIIKQEALGLSDAVLTISKSKSYRQTSEFMSTPFGKCRANFNGVVGDKQRFVIFVPIEGMKKFLKKIEGSNVQGK